MYIQYCFIQGYQWHWFNFPLTLSFLYIHGTYTIIICNDSWKLISIKLFTLRDAYFDIFTYFFSYSMIFQFFLNNISGLLILNFLVICRKYLRLMHIRI